jgi:glucose-6-phosphate 1-dehydrogenase
MPVIQAWGGAAPEACPNYAAGTWGPAAVDRLLAPGHRWPLPMELIEPITKK